MPLVPRDPQRGHELLRSEIEIDRSAAGRERCCAQEKRNGANRRANHEFVLSCEGALHAHTRRKKSSKPKPNFKQVQFRVPLVHFCGFLLIKLTLVAFPYLSLLVLSLDPTDLDIRIAHDLGVRTERKRQIFPSFQRSVAA